MYKSISRFYLISIIELWRRLPIAKKVWKKVYELKALKSEMVALDWKIQLELAPPTASDKTLAEDIKDAVPVSQLPQVTAGNMVDTECDE